MTIPRTRFDPVSYGLPSEAEIASRASVWFPEFDRGGGKSPPCLQPALRSSGTPLSGGFTPATPPHSAALAAEDVRYAPDAAALGGSFPAQPESSGAVAPRVIPLGTDVSPYRRPGSAAQPFTARSQDPSLSRRIGSKSLAAIRADFPILAEKVNGHDLIWLDNAATTQRPRAVIDRLTYFYEHENSNVHRGAHELAARATDAMEGARKKIARFIGAPSAENIVFVRGTTEGINLAAQAYLKQFLKPADEIILTMLEHHANIVPWQLIAEETGALIRAVPIDNTGQLSLSAYERLFNSRTRFVAATHVSNALGTVTPVAELIHIAHSRGVPILIDGAQAVSHLPVNVASLDVDFYVFSGHKIFGPTGIGALYGKKDVLEAARPYQGGGNMIAEVTFERTLYQPPPAKFEAGTGNIADAVGLGAALDYVDSIGIENIAAWEQELVQYGMKSLSRVPGLRLVGTAPHKASVLSFTLDRFSNEAVGTFLNTKGIAVRAGHHCAQPGLRFLGLEGTVRPSVAFYNTFEEIDQLVQALYELTGKGTG